MPTVRCKKNAHLMERLGQFEIIEENLRDEVMITQSEKYEILLKVKGPQKIIASVTTYLTGMKAVNDKLKKYNELLSEARKHQIKINETLRFENSELLRLKKSSKKILERLCEEKKSITPNTKELPQKCKYYKEIETVKDKLQSRIDSLSTKIETTWCQKNEENVVLEGEI